MKGAAVELAGTAVSPGGSLYIQDRLEVKGIEGKIDSVCFPRGC